MTVPVRFGVLRLTDSAPAVLALADGLFEQAGLAAELCVEPSWANLADKLAWGALDAAILLTPLAMAAAAGLRGPPSGLLAPMGISRGGNSIVLRPDVADSLPAFAGDSDGAGRCFAEWLHRQPEPPRFAIVHVYSMHNLLLRSWLAGAGVDPDRAVDIVVVPPERVVEELDAGRIVGFCAGAPWADRAAELDAGRLLIGSSAIRPGHVEKSLALSSRWAAAHPSEARDLCKALQQAQALCASPENAARLAKLLCEHLDLPRVATRCALPGGGGTEQVGFANASVLDPSEIGWIASEMSRWGWLSPEHQPFIMRAVRPI